MEDINRLSFNDKYQVEDSFTPKGFVIIRDENGNIIFKGHNMVVKSGRKVLFDLFTTGAGKTLANMKPFFGNNITMVAANDKLSSDYETLTITPEELPSTSIPTELYKKKTTDVYEETTEDDFMVAFEKGLDDNNNIIYTRLVGDDKKLYYVLDENNLVIHMGFNYTHNSSPIEFSTFGLYYDDTLFSRIVFPKRIFSESTPLVIDYYLYF